jgi:hypothetical protein
VIGEIGQSARVRHHADDIEEHLDWIEPVASLPDALHERGGAPDHKGFRKSQIHHAQQDEEEIHRHGAVDAGQLDF